MCSMSIMWAFVYRYTILISKDHLLNSAGGIAIMGLGMVCYEVPTIILYSLSMLDREAVVEAIYAVLTSSFPLPCIEPN
jgi:hypothetical protein